MQWENLAEPYFLILDTVFDDGTDSKRFSAAIQILFVLPYPVSELLDEALLIDAFPLEEVDQCTWWRYRVLGVESRSEYRSWNVAFQAPQSLLDETALPEMFAAMMRIALHGRAAADIEELSRVMEMAEIARQATRNFSPD